MRLESGVRPGLGGCRGGNEPLGWIWNAPNGQEAAVTKRMFAVISEGFLEGSKPEPPRSSPPYLFPGLEVTRCIQGMIFLLLVCEGLGSTVGGCGS